MTTNKGIWTPANIVTMLRICGVPLFVVALISPWPSWLPSPEQAEAIKPFVATIIFVILACTDSVDGYLARSRNEVTTFGKLIDPLADKILVAAALIALVELRVLPSWVVLIILAREFIVSGIRMIASAEGYIIAASWYGKVKTVLQMVAIVLFLIKDALKLYMNLETWYALYWFSWAVMIAALAMTLISLADYLYKSRGLFGFSTTQEESLPEQIIKKAAAQNITIGTAESLTGGKIAAGLTSVPGASSVVKGGVASYTNEIKHKVLGVHENTLSNYGAVSEQTAREMAENARTLLNCDIAVSVTGIAGPSSDESGLPAGTVWLAIATSTKSETTLFHFCGTREEIRDATVEAAFTRILVELAD